MDARAMQLEQEAAITQDMLDNNHAAVAAAQDSLVYAEKDHRRI